MKSAYYSLYLDNVLWKRLQKEHLARTLAGTQRVNPLKVAGAVAEYMLNKAGMRHSGTGLVPEITKVGYYISDVRVTTEQMGREIEPYIEYFCYIMSNLTKKKATFHFVSRMEEVLALGIGIEV